MTGENNPALERASTGTPAAMFRATAAAYKDRPALWAEGSAISYAELLGRASAIARAIVDAGSENVGDPVCLFAYRSQAAFAGLLGILLAGRAYVPLNPKFPTQRSYAMAEASQAQTMLVDKRCQEQAAALLSDPPRRFTVILLGDADLPPDVAACHHVLRIDDNPQAREFIPPEAPRPDLPAYLLFTSGSTGKPKGVLIANASVLSYVRNVIRFSQPDENDRFSQIFDLTFDASVHDIFVCWASGGCLCIVPENAVLSPANFIRERQLTFWCSVPSTVTFMAKLGMLKPGAFPTLRCTVFCGEALHEVQAAAWAAAAPGSIIENLYGPTEATVLITHYRWRPAPGSKSSVVPIGQIFEDQHVVIVDEMLKPVPNGQTGEICLGGDQLAIGYWRNPALTAERFTALNYPGDHVGRWYRTGDLGHVAPDGRLIFQGRMDHQVKIRGYRVELEEIEKVVQASADAELAVALGWPENSQGVAMGVVVFVLPRASFNDVAVIAACRKHLPDYMVPARIITLDSIPVNANGKVDRGALKARLGAKD
jgi:amino acid adenylation domain-containing protein